KSPRQRPHKASRHGMATATTTTTTTTATATKKQRQQRGGATHLCGGRVQLEAEELAVEPRDGDKGDGGGEAGKVGRVRAQLALAVAHGARQQRVRRVHDEDEHRLEILRHAARR